MNIEKWAPQQDHCFAWFAKDQDYLQEFYTWKDNLVDANNNLIIRARAGTGKTTVIVEGVKRAPERSILICAFSKIIQEELERRFTVDGVRLFPHIQAKTLHSVGLSCIRRFRNNIKIDFSSTRADYLTEKVCGRTTPDDIKRLVTKLHTKGREIAPHATKLGELTDIAIRFECEPDESWANAGFSLDFVEQAALNAMELAANVQSGEIIDGSDMIFLPVRNHWLQGLFDLVVVDEGQDMSNAQLEIGKGVLKKGGRICIVGDNRQAIFGWRGADSNSLDRLKEELHAGELNLTTTYRCGHAIVALAQAIVPDFEAGENNPAGEILEIHPDNIVRDAGPGDFILSRVNAPLVSTAMKLLRAGKRTRIAGRDIGKGLVTLVKKMRARSVPDFMNRITAWESKELSRLQPLLEKAVNGRKNTIMQKMEEISDKAEMLTSLADGAKNVQEIEDRIEALFSDDGLGAEGMITCSTVHRAKGLEANRVFILEDTLRNYNIEEDNITYVAVTRAKQTLIWVSDRYKA